MLLKFDFIPWKEKKMWEYFANFLAQFGSDFSRLSAADLSLILGVVALDAALSGDNSVAINALAMGVPERRRNMAIWLGLVFAAVLRVVALMCAALILRHPSIQFFGAWYLIYLCLNHFRSTDEEEADAKKHGSLVGALIAIGILDLSLSLDNVVAVAAMSQNLAIIVIGVLISIAMLAVATKLVQMVMRTFPSLERAGFLILGFLGAMMLAEHGTEGLEEINRWVAQIPAWKIELGQTFEIVGVAFLIGAAIVHDMIRRRRNAKNVLVKVAPAE
ncbi:hypothetical protein HZC00_00160 [Candidatus Kaiserbacteria bacterium]|nr:hypothetical protein [Candidatus Kaiserbacteria bacterium]